MPSWNPSFTDSEELAQRVARIRQHCDDLENALGAGAQQRNLLIKIKRDADDVYRALTSAKHSG